MCARAAAASTLAFSPASPSFVDSPAAAGPSARWPRDRSTIKNDRNMGRKYIHHHRPRGLGVAPGVPDKILGNNMTGAVVVDKIPGPGGAGYLSTTIAPAMLWPRIVSGTPGAAPKPPRAVGVDISRPGIKYTASVELSHPENWWFAQCLSWTTVLLDYVPPDEPDRICTTREPGHNLAPDAELRLTLDRILVSGGLVLLRLSWPLMSDACVIGKTSRDASRDTTWDTGRDTGQDTSRDRSRDRSRDTSRDTHPVFPGRPWWGERSARFETARPTRWHPGRQRGRFAVSLSRTKKRNEIELGRP